MNKFKEGDVVLATYGFNPLLNKPFQFLYEFGYYTKKGCVVYNQGEHSMQDAHSFTLEEVELATPEDIKNHYWGN